MDFSDLSQGARDRIAAAEIEAGQIRKRGEALAKVAKARAKIPWSKPNDFSQTLLEVAGRDHQSRARLQEAIYHGCAIVREYLELGNLCDAKLNEIWHWISRNHHIRAKVLDEVKQHCRALVLRRRAAVLESNPIPTEQERPADDPFATPEGRQIAAKRARQKHGTFKAAAQAIGVKYTDLCAWRRDRGRTLAKHHSDKVERIEDNLKSLQ